MQKFFSRLVYHDIVFYSICTLLIIALGQIPIILRLDRTPPDHYYPYLDKVFYTDFHYPSVVRYAMEGNEWTTQHPHIWQEHEGYHMQFFYVLLGKIAKVVSLDSFAILALARIVAGVLLVMSVVLFLKQHVSKTAARWIFVLFLLVQPIPLFFTGENFFHFDIGEWIWDLGEATRRISMMAPHYNIGKACMLFGLFFVYRFIKFGSVVSLLFSFVFLFFGGISYPMPNFLIAISIGLALLLYGLYTRFSLRSLRSREVVGLVFMIVFSLVPIVLLYLESSKGFPANIWRTAELGFNTREANFEIRYLHMLGLILLFIPFGLHIKKFTAPSAMLSFLLPVWFITPFVLFPFANTMMLGKNRLIDGLPLLPAVILGYSGMRRITGFLRTYSRQAKSFVQILIIFVFGGWFSWFGGLALYQSTMRLWKIHQNVYFMPEEQEALEFLRENVQHDTVVLAGLRESNYITAFVRVRTIIGNPIVWPDDRKFARDFGIIRTIQLGQLPEYYAREYLQQRNVRYVYTQIYTIEQLRLYPSLLKRVFSNRSFIIYKVKDEVFTE